ncbi:MAG: WD40 repeat domain-containing protein, partial [Microcystaceae cyanobacterium]
VLAVAVSPDGKTLVSGSVDRTVKLWDIHTSQCLQTLEEHTSRVWSVAFSPTPFSPLTQGGTEGGYMLATGSEDKTLKLWNVETGQCLKTLQGHQNLLKSIAFSPDGQTLVTSSFDETMKIWNVQTGQCLKILRVKRPYENMNIAGATGLTEAQKATLKALGAIEVQQSEPICKALFEAAAFSIRN